MFTPAQLQAFDDLDQLLFKLVPVQFSPSLIVTATVDWTLLVKSLKAEDLLR